TTELCSTGSASEVVGEGPWMWSCAGMGGGASVSCTATATADGVCGMANGVSVTAAPTEALCDHGKPSAVSGNGPWRWTCAGSGGGAAASCVAPLRAGEAHTIKAEDIDHSGICGMAANVATEKTPTDGLCSIGMASEVSSGAENWTWSCTNDKTGA